MNVALYSNTPYSIAFLCPGNILRLKSCSNIVNGMTDLNYAYTSPSFALALVVTAVTFLEQIIGKDEI